MDLNKKVLRKMTVLMLSGVFLSPFVSIASDVVGHGGQTIGYVDGQNHMVASGQVHKDMDITDVEMDGDHMMGNNGQASMQHGSMDAEQMNNGNPDSMLNSRSSENLSTTGENTRSGREKGHGTRGQTGVHSNDKGGMMSGSMGGTMGHSSSSGGGSGGHGGGGM
jgi:hypothetical protein